MRGHGSLYGNDDDLPISTDRSIGLVPRSVDREQWRVKEEDSPVQGKATRQEGENAGRWFLCGNWFCVITISSD